MFGAETEHIVSEPTDHERWVNAGWLVVLSIIVSFFAAILAHSIYYSLIIADRKPEGDNAPVILQVISVLVFLGSWALTSWLLMSGAFSTGRVLRRAFLLWAAEWLLLVFASLVGNIISALTKQEVGPIAAVAAVLGQLATIGFCFIMAAGCLMGYVVVLLIPREFVEDKTKRSADKGVNDEETKEYNWRSIAERK